MPIILAGATAGTQLLSKRNVPYTLGRMLYEAGAKLKDAIDRGSKDIYHIKILLLVMFF